MAGGAIPANLAPIFRAAGAQYGVPPAVLAGISSVESNLFRNQGPSSAGAVGGMQFLPSTARGLGINPLDPRQAIFGAAKLLIQYGYRQNPTRAIAAYNAGPGNFTAGLGYARQVTSEAQRLSSQLHGGSGGMPGIAPQAQSSSGTIPVTTQSFDQAGFKQALGKFIAGQAVKQSSGSSNPFNTIPGASRGLSSLDTSGPLFAKGLLTTSSPNPQAFVHAQTSLQQIAGATPLTAHPAVAGATGRPGNIAGGFLPQGARYVPGRKDQGRDGQTNPGGALVAPGNGFVVRVGSDPAGFGPRYAIVHFTSGRYAGRTMYLGHTLAAVTKGSFRAGQTLAHTGTSPVGNASVPGWFEIGYADSGSPGPLDQPAPF